MCLLRGTSWIYTIIRKTTKPRNLKRTILFCKSGSIWQTCALTWSFKKWDCKWRTPLRSAQISPRRSTLSELHTVSRYTCTCNCMYVHKKKHGLASDAVYETQECSATCSKHLWDRLSCRLEKRLVTDRGTWSAHNAFYLLCKHCIKCVWREYSRLYQLSQNSIGYYYYYYSPFSAHVAIETTRKDVPMLRSALQRRTLPIR